MEEGERDEEEGKFITSNTMCYTLVMFRTFLVGSRGEKVGVEDISGTTGRKGRERKGKKRRSRREGKERREGGEG